MTPQQFKEARLSLGLSARQLSIILNTNERTIRRWETDDGTRPVNPIAIRVMEWMMAGYRPPEFPQD
jgi:DNA-binding transcriptional regulator YiaG